MEEVEHRLQELEESIDVQKQVESALGISFSTSLFLATTRHCLLNCRLGVTGSIASYTSIESEEDIEEELKRLEVEIEGHRPAPKAEAESAATEVEEALDSLGDSFSKLEVVSTTQASPAKETKNVELEAA